MGATSQNPDLFNDYDGFVEKFKPKKTTDDCYTPEIVYNAIADWVRKKYDLQNNDFCRPFYPGGDYEHFDYADKIVVDNPPFSILSKIVQFYTEHKIKFFLFAPTLSSLVGLSEKCTALAVGVDITYENGAVIPTSFVTNMDDPDIRLKTEPSLYTVVHEANTRNRAQQTKTLPKYSYPINVVTVAMVYPFSRYGIDFKIPRAECKRISALDSQKDKKKSIFGSGLLTSDRVATEREKAEREKAEREKAERWELSSNEKNIISQLNNNSLC